MCINKGEIHALLVGYWLAALHKIIAVFYGLHFLVVYLDENQILPK